MYRPRRLENPLTLGNRYYELPYLVYHTTDNRQLITHIMSRVCVSTAMGGFFKGRMKLELSDVTEPPQPAGMEQALHLHH